MDFLNLNLDKTLASNSNTTISSQKALKSYIDAKRILLNFLQDTEPTVYNAGDKWLNTSTNKLYIATNNSNWGSPIDLNIDQVYSFENLLYHFNGTNIQIYSTESITEQNNNYEIKTWFGTQNEYDALTTYDTNTLYNIVDNVSIISTLLATQTQFNNSVQNKAATPYQVNQALGNYLPLSGGNLNAGAILRLTNTNNQVVSLSYDTNNYLNISNNLLVNGSISANNLIATSGNIYNGSISGAKAIWNNDIATTNKLGIIKPDGTTTTVDADGVLTVIGGGSGGGTNLPLFMSFWSDHKLNNVSFLRADTFSWQPGSVYTAGYQELLSEYNNASSTTETDGGEWISNNITPYGSLIDDEGIISGFTSNTTFASFNAITPTSSFEIVVKCKQDTLNTTGSILQTTANYTGIVLRCINASTGQINMWVGNGSSNFISNVNTNCTLQAGVWTYLKVASDGTNYTVSQSADGTTWTTNYTSANTNMPNWTASGTQAFGACTWETYPFTTGYIDLNETYLNIDGERYWTGCNYTAIITYKRTPKEYKIVDATQEQAILNLYNSTGVALYYILDTTNTRFKLPRTKYGFVGLRDGVGNYVSESLPNLQGKFNITHTYGEATKVSGVFAADNVTGTKNGSQANTSGCTIDFNASRYSSTYQNNAPVQQRATQMYLYFYVGNYTQSAIEQTAGLNTELFNGKVDVSSLVEVPVIIDMQLPTAENNYTWYILYSNDWVEQGGMLPANSQEATVTFLIEMLDTNYCIQNCWNGGKSSSFYSSDQFIRNITTTGYTTNGPAQANVKQRNWEVKGMAAIQQ